MGDDRVFQYIKSKVEIWRSPQARRVVSIDEVKTNLSLMDCERCGGEGTVTVGGTVGNCDMCGPPHSDGLRTFQFIGNVVDIEERPYTRLSGEVPKPYYEQRARAANIFRKGKATKGKATEEKKTVFIFTMDDGENAVRCCVHNFVALCPNGVPDAQLPDIVRVIRSSQTNGMRIMVKGKPYPFKESRFKEIPLFFVDTVTPDTSDFVSRLLPEDLAEFLVKCKESTDYEPSPLEKEVRPLDVVRRELWKKMIIPDYLKDAMTLWCVSPCEHQEQLHIALITNPGEGKDYMVKKILRPIARVGMAGSGLTTRAAALVGAMSSQNLSKISLGLLPKYHNARVCISEFTSWKDDMWSALLGVMAEGEVWLSKGEIAGRHKSACLNLLLLGNPPRTYEEGYSSKFDTLQVFGNYTYPMISRCGLIFVVSKLSDDDVALWQRIVENIDRDTGAGVTDERLVYFQEFFKEYFKLVSSLKAKIDPVAKVCNFTYESIAEDPRFVQFLTRNGRRDTRKYIQFLNVVKSYAKANGRLGFRDGIAVIVISPSDIRNAGELFRKSASTLADNFDPTLLDIRPEEGKILRYVIENPGQSMTEIRRALRLTGEEQDSFVATTFRTLETLGKVHNIDDSYFVDRIDTKVGEVPHDIHASDLMLKEEARSAPTASPPPISLPDRAELERDPIGAYTRIVKDRLKFDESVARALGDYYDSFGHTTTAGHFALKVEELTRGQIKEDIALSAYNFLKGVGL